MPTVKRHKTVPAGPDEVWDLISDPWQLPRWWPRVERVEDATREAWTNVMVASSGRAVRADYTRTEARRPRRLVWRQELDESPFEHLLAEAVTEISLEPEGTGATRVELKAVQKLRGKARYGGFMARRAARRHLDSALEGLREALEEGEGEGEGEPA